jgi:hypothetical protein
MALIVSPKFEIARKRHWRCVDGRVKPGHDAEFEISESSDPLRSTASAIRATAADMERLKRQSVAENRKQIKIAP